MNAEQATDILGVNRRRHGNLREVLRALTLYPWLNTAEDEKRRIAARWALTHGKSTRTNAPGAARRHPPEPGRQVFDADRGENLQPQLANSPRLQRFDGLTCPTYWGACHDEHHGDLTREGIKMLRLAAILLMTCALVPVYGRDKTAIDRAREDVEAAKKSPSVQLAPPAPPKRSDSITVTIIRKMKREEYSVPRSNQE